MEHDAKIVTLKAITALRVCSTVNTSETGYALLSTPRASHNSLRGYWKLIATLESFSSEGHRNVFSIYTWIPNSHSAGVTRLRQEELVICLPSVQS